MRGRDNRPPPLARLIVRLRRSHADVDADLLELFDARVAERGVAYARRLYWRDAVSLWIYRTSDQNRHEVSSSRGPEIASIAQDLTFAVRLFRRQPTVVVVTVTGLALAVGVATAIFSILNAIALRPIGAADPAAIVRVMRTLRNGTSTGWPYSEYLRMRDAARSARLEAFTREGGPLGVALGDDQGGSVPVHLVSGGYFTTFGGGAAIGRALLLEDDRPGSPLVAVVNHSFWRNHYDSDTSIVGRTVYFFGMPATVVGVAHRGFSGAALDAPAFWLPLVPAQKVWSYLGPFHAASAASVSVTARLMPGVAMSQAEAELSTLAGNALPAGPDFGTRGTSGARLEPADTRAGGRLRTLVAVVLTAVGLVLLLACVNVANLLLASATTRQREIGVRLALGAGRGRIVRQLLTESLMLAIAGGALGFLVVVWALPALATLLQVPSTMDVAPDFRVYVFTVLVSVLAGVAPGLVPARYGTRGTLLPMLGSDSVQSGSAPKSRFLRASFLAAQAAASIVLLIAAALLARAAVHVSRVDLGFDAERLIAISAGFARANYDDGRAAQYWDAALDRVKSLPGVEEGALVEHLPFGESRQTSSRQRDGRLVVLHHNRTSAEYFQTAGIRIVSGRAYTPDEVRGRAQVAVISESLAREFWGAEDPVGSTLDRVGRGLAGIWVVGIARGAITGGFAESAPPVLYRPVTDATVSRLLVRTRGDSTALLGPVRDAMRAIDPAVTLNVWPVREGVARELKQVKAPATLATLVGGVALGLALIGIFGATTFAVSQRTREIGVRVAVGATARDVRQLLMRDSLRPVIIGLAVGVAAALLGTRVLSRMLYGVSSHDPLAIGLAALVLLSSAALAVVVPARRASRIDPVSILRQL